MKQLVEECDTGMQANSARMNLDNNAYAVYTVLKGFAEEITPEQTREVE